MEKNFVHLELTEEMSEAYTDALVNVEGVEVSIIQYDTEGEDLDLDAYVKEADDFYELYSLLSDDVAYVEYTFVRYTPQCKSLISKWNDNSEIALQLDIDVWLPSFPTNEKQIKVLTDLQLFDLTANILMDSYRFMAIDDEDDMSEKIHKFIFVESNQ